MPVDGGESGRSVRDLQRGTDTLVAVHRGAPTGARGQGGSNGGVLKMLSRRDSLARSLARSPTRALAVSRDNWDTVYYRLRAIHAVRGV